MIEFILANDYTHFISGMALGGDTVFALAVLKLKKQYPERGYILECAIPCKNHFIKWNRQSQDEWHVITASADIVTYVSDRSYTYSCMENRNKYMVDKSDAVLAVWNGTNGGTANCIDYANRKNKPVFNIY